MKYTCDKCGAIFNRKSNYEKHMTRKTPCEKDKNEKYHNDKKTCIHCNKMFSKASIALSHQKKCSHKPSEIEELQKTILLLKDELVNIKNSGVINNGTINNGTTINNTINIQNNIVIKPYGSEDLSYLTVNDYKKILKKGCFSVPEIIKMIHCNDEKPEYRNVYIKSLQNDYILTHNGTEWVIEEKDDVIHNIIESKKNFLEGKFEDHYDKLSKIEKLTFQKFLDRSDNSEVVDNIKKELKMILYNNRTHIVKSKK